MPVLDRPGTFISYHTAGHGPALLLTHGFAATSQMFAANMPALTRRNLVVTWDIRGHGASGDPADQACYSAQASIEDMAAILDRLGIGQAVIGGHSLGGYLSLRFALAHPQRVSGLLLIGTGPGFRSDASRAQWNRVAERYASNLTEQGLDGLAAEPGLQPGAHRSAAGLALAARGILTQHDSTVIDSLDTIRVPTLIVVGAEDTRFLAAADYLAGKISDARLVVIPGAGHAPNISHPGQFDRRVRAFLDEVAARPAVPGQ